MAQPKKTGTRPNMTKTVYWDVKHQHKPKQMDVNQSIRWSDVTDIDRHKPETPLIFLSIFIY